MSPILSKTWLTAFTLLAFALASQAVAEDKVAKTSGYKTVSDIAYRGEQQTDEYIQERCRLDVYYPTDIPDFATVVWFHGGGLTGGNRFVPKELDDASRRASEHRYSRVAGVQSRSDGCSRPRIAVAIRKEDL